MTTSKVIVSERDNIAALFEDDKATEFIIHRGDTLLGDVYLATVENILPSIDAAFVNVGGDKMGFLHSSDVKGRGDLKTRIKPGEKMVVQVIKEPTGHKGPRVTTNISLPGRFLVFMPDSKGISISRKIEDPEERSRLKAIVSMSKPHGVGVIIRTEAQGQKESDLTEDFETLLDRWQTIVTAADASSKHTLLYRDQDLLYRVIREIVTDDVNEIVVDTAFGQQRAQQLLQTWNLDKGVKVTQYQGNQSIMIGTGLEREIKLALQTKVPLPSGGYLFIQPTEALAVVDVNSGKFTSLSSQSETIRLTNLEACKEIARQLRLRNIGGMIVVDFIDMESRADQLSILEAFDKELQPDKSKPQMGQLTDLGLVEMTRHRQGQALTEIFTKDCPTCQGRAHVHEIFSWAPANAEEESKMFGRGGRASGGRFQQRRQRGGNTSSRGGSSGGGRDKRDSKDSSAGRSRQGKATETKTVEVPRLKPSKSSILLDKKKVLNYHQIDDHLKHQMSRCYGAPLAQAIQVGFTPERQNRVLSRMNPKSNDIKSLAASNKARAEMAKNQPIKRAQSPAASAEVPAGKMPPVSSSAMQGRSSRQGNALKTSPTEGLSVEPATKQAGQTTLPTATESTTPSKTTASTPSGIPSFLSSLFKGSGKTMIDASQAAAELAAEQNMAIELPSVPTTPSVATEEISATSNKPVGAEAAPEEQPKRRGRPPKTASRAKSRASATVSEDSEDKPKRRRGRPAKVAEPSDVTQESSEPASSDD